MLPGTPVIRAAVDDAAPVAYDVVMMTQESLRQNEAKVATPRITISYAPFSASITCATGDAVIYYTVDGSYPWSGNASAVIYYSAFIPTGTDTIIRAAAFKDFYVPSNVGDLRLEGLAGEGGELLGQEGGGGLAP